MKQSNLHKIVALIGFALLIGCAKDTLNEGFPVADTPFPPDNNPPIVRNYYFSGIIDSQVVILQDSIQGYTHFVDSVNYGPCDTSNNMVSHGVGIVDELTLTQGVKIRFLSCTDDMADSTMNSTKIFQGSYPYGSSALTSLKSGVEIQYIAPNGQVWKSLPGTGANTNMSFSILQIDELFSPADTLGDLVITGVMRNVRLFDGIRFVPVEKAEFRLPVGKF